MSDKLLMITIKLSNLHYALPNVGEILRDINFEILPGEFVGVLGKNGEGKSTLLDLMLGFRTPIEGSVEVLDENPFSDERINKQYVSYISQDIELKGDFTVARALEFHRLFYAQYDLEYEKELCHIFKVKTKAKISSLSTGFHRRIQIIASLASRPKVILIDEITAVLDPEARKLLFEVLKDYQAKNKATILMATNVIEDLKGYASRILFLEDGKVTEVDPQAIYDAFSKKAG